MYEGKLVERFRKEPGWVDRGDSFYFESTGDEIGYDLLIDLEERYDIKTITGVAAYLHWHTRGNENV